MNYLTSTGMTWVIKTSNVKWQKAKDEEKMNLGFRN
jgi:hypothetical protein